ncbi:MAG: nucleotide sugar dehydrogenase [Rhodospirillales bacterium]|nr:nucleotide sugar dehydrogenase [Alphaproteobacteria bacterium]USO03790.1 MAG: nucleotide sugar dehydrogenase [Rhodospirillales bacterium]
MIKNLKETSLAVIGLGYVGLPLAVMLSQHFKTIGFDLNEERINELKKGRDNNRETKQADLKSCTCHFTSDCNDISECQIYIITVPTPINSHNEPDLNAVKSATQSVAKHLKKGDIVVYESTVYPGVTENICGALLAEKSGLTCGQDFYLGYSPERINPGDTQHTIENITKVVSGQTPEVTEILAEIYARVTKNNVFKAKDIKTAEASKAIENAQRDINVAFINEVTMILNKMGISACDVLEAAGTKWNFLNFTPGLVGGHCISVDPYYLAHCAREIGHEPEVILAGRQTNDRMGAFIADRVDACIGAKKKPANILILGFTFKENINDIRNTKVIDVVKTLEKKGHNVDVHDPFAQIDKVKKEYGLSIKQTLPANKKYDCVALMVEHKTYKEMTAASLERLLIDDSASIFDVKGCWKLLDFSPKISYETL